MNKTHVVLFIIKDAKKELGYQCWNENEAKESYAVKYSEDDTDIIDIIPYDTELCDLIIFKMGGFGVVFTKMTR